MAPNLQQRLRASSDFDHGAGQRWTIPSKRNAVRRHKSRRRLQSHPTALSRCKRRLQTSPPDKSGPPLLLTVIPRGVIRGEEARGPSSLPTPCPHTMESRKGRRRLCNLGAGNAAHGVLGKSIMGLPAPLSPGSFARRRVASLVVFLVFLPR